MAISFSCPKCKKVLKAANPIPAGKNVKCSSCGNVFPMPGTKEDDTGIKARPAPAAARKTAPPPPRDEDQDDRPRKPARKGGYVDDDDDDDRPRRSSRRVRADDDDDEDDDRPARRGKKGGRLGLILGIAAGVVLLAVVGVGGFVWPGFFRGGSGGGGGGGGGKAETALFDFVPANCDLVMGADMGWLRNRPGLLDTFISGLQAKKKLTSTQIEIIKNADRGIMAGNANGPSGLFVLAFTTLNPQENEKVRQAFEAGQGKTLEGKTIYPLPGGREFLAMPNSKTIVLGGNMQENDFVRLLAVKGQLPPALQQPASAVQQASFWTVVNIQSGMMQKNLGEAGQVLAMFPNGQQVQGALQRAKSASLSLEITNGAKANLALDCGNETDAGAVDKLVNDLWQNQGKGALQEFSMVLGNQPAMKGLTQAINEVAGTFVIQRQGVRVSVSVALTENTLKELSNMKLPQGGLGGF